MLIVKADTITTIQFGIAVDKTDGVTLETGLATAMDNATTGIRVSKNGGTYADRNSATAPSYDAIGMYKVALSATDTDTEGTLQLVFEEAATCLPIILNLQVVSSNTYDSLYSTLNADYLHSDVVQVGGSTEDIATETKQDTIDTNIDAILVDTSTSIPSDIAALNNFNPATDAVANVTLTATTTTSTDMRGTDSAATATSLAAAQTDLDTITGTDGVTLATAQALYAPSKIEPDNSSIASILVDTAEIGAAGAGLTNIGTIATVTDVTNEVTADMTKISGNTTAADNLEASALGIHSTTVATAASATEFTLTAGATADDIYIGRIVVVTSGTHAGEATDVTDYVGSTKTVTVTAFTDTLTASDDIVIV
jgi:hypothetical protein